jgi:hypothetical protein
MSRSRPVGRQGVNGRAVDLSRVGLSDDEARRTQEMLEHRLGMRCDGCGRRIQIGFKFASIDPRHQSPVLNLSTCTRDDCGYAEQCREGATVMEMVEFAWLDENGPDAPASLHIVERNEMHARNADGTLRAENHSTKD